MQHSGPESSLEALSATLSLWGQRGKAGKAHTSVATASSNKTLLTSHPPVTACVELGGSRIMLQILPLATILIPCPVSTGFINLKNVRFISDQGKIKRMITVP